MPDTLTPTRRLLLAVLCAVSVANVYYAQPLLERIGSDLSISTGRLGWLVAAGQAGYLIGLAALVPLGDWLNRRRLIPAHLVLIAVATSVAATAASPAVLFAAVVVAGLFSVVVQIAVAYAAARSAPGERGRNLGVVTSGVVVGIILARTVAGFVATVGGWRAVYAGAAVLAVVMAVLVRVALPDDPRRPAPHSYARTVVSVFVLAAADRVFRTRALIAFFLFASFGVLWSGLALPLSDAPWRLSPAQIGLFGFAGLAGTLGAARAGRWADRGRADPVTVVALVLLIGSWCFIGRAERNLWLVAVGAVLLDLAVQAVHVTNQNLIVAKDPDSSSRIIGAYMICYSLGSALGAVTTSTLYARGGWSAACVAGASFAGAALVVWLVERGTRHRVSLRSGSEHTMKAAQFSRFGGPEVLEITERPDPHPGAGEIRIAVRAAGVNASDWKKRAGLMDPELPQTLGYEAAGVVDELGEGVTGVTLGDRVFGFCTDGAAQAELAVLSFWAPIPSSLDFAGAATLPAAVETATRALDQLGVANGHTLLVNGASGTVGSAAVQLAVARGARVIGTASAANHDYLRTLGVEAVAYGDGLVDRVRELAPDGVDLALDVAGSGVLPELITLAGGADHVLTVADVDGAQRHGVRFSRGDSGRALHALVDIGALVETGRFVPPEVRTFALADVADAHRAGEQGTRGKLVLVVD